MPDGSQLQVGVCTVQQPHFSCAKLSWYTLIASASTIASSTTTIRLHEKQRMKI